MIRDVEFVEIKMAQKFPTLAEELQQDTKYEIYIKGILHPYLYIYYETKLQKFSLRIKMNHAVAPSHEIYKIHNNSLVYCNTLQEARKYFYLHQISVINPSKGKHWCRWMN
jgi:hypothetical protein